MAKYLVVKTKNREDYAAAVELIISTPGCNVIDRTHPLGTVVECDEETAQVLDLKAV